MQEMQPSYYGCCLRRDVRTFAGGRFCLSCGCALPDADNPSLPLSIHHTAQPAHIETPQFIHTPLLSPMEFRLLKLLPGAPTEPLRGEIFHADVSATPPYEALSYTWGSNRLTSSILINEKPFRVTENCQFALQNLRESSNTRTLWIDAICINQADNGEKNHQIPLMTRIYSQAQHTLIYLGNESRLATTRLFDYLRRRDKSGNKALRPADLSEEQKISYQGELSWVLSLSWFTRVWVLQEVAVSRQALLVLGRDALNWNSLSLGNIYSLGLKPVNKEGEFPRVLQLSHNELEPIKDLASLLAVARSCFSTDPRDKIYALLGIFRDGENFRISVDYNKRVEQIFAEVALRVIETYGHLELLSEAGAGTSIPSASPEKVMGLKQPQTWGPQSFPVELGGICEILTGSRRRNSALPTWVPDYSHHPDVVSLAPWRPKVPGVAGKEPIARLCSSDTIGGPILRVVALEVDKVNPTGAQSITTKSGRWREVFVLQQQYLSERTARPPYWTLVPAFPNQTDNAANWKDLPEIQTHLKHRFWETFEPQLERSGHGTNIDALYKFSSGKTLVVTENSFAISPKGNRPGDLVCLIKGASVPFLLRPVNGAESTYQLAGECYLHGTKGPTFVDDYMELLGVFKNSFACTDQRDLPWKEAYLV